MKSFKYTVATSESAACRLLGQGSAALAGGTNLLSLMKEYVLEPDVVVDIKKIPSLAAIEPAGDGLRLGANVTLSELLANEHIRAGYPLLVQALAECATPQIRNRGTLGGNLCGRPACWYFSHGAFDCAKKGGTGCPAVEGENEFHAIFDTDGPCVMVHASTIAPALLAIGAQARIAGTAGAREVPLEEFFASPRQDVRSENVLAAGEILTHVTLGPPVRHSATYEVRQKAAHDWPVCTASVVLDLSIGICQQARIYLGAVAPVPWRARAAEAVLAGKRVTPELAEEASRAAVEGAHPLSQNKYKVAATQAAARRAVLLAATGKWS